MRSTRSLSVLNPYAPARELRDKVSAQLDYDDQMNWRREHPEIADDVSFLWGVERHELERQ